MEAGSRIGRNGWIPIIIAPAGGVFLISSSKSTCGSNGTYRDPGGLVMTRCQKIKNIESVKNATNKGCRSVLKGAGREIKCHLVKVEEGSSAGSLKDIALKTSSIKSTTGALVGG